MNSYGKIVRVGDDNQSAVIDVGGVELEVQLMRPSGDASTPVKGDTVVYSEIKGHGESVAVGYYDSKVEATESGGRLLYSRDSSGTKKATIEMTTDGKVYLNGDGKSLVTWGELSTALNSLVSSINVAFASKKDEVGSSPGLTIDISSSKTNTLKTDG